MNEDAPLSVDLARSVTNCGSKHFPTLFPSLSSIYHGDALCESSNLDGFPRPTVDGVDNDDGGFNCSNRRCIYYREGNVNSRQRDANTPQP